MQPPKDDDPKAVLEKHEHRAHLGVELMEAAAGAAAGAAIGALAGPVGVAAGAILGAAAGAVLGVEAEALEHEQADHDKDLDDIGREAPSKRGQSG